MAQMISAKFAEEVIIREMGVNHTKGIELQKMAIDHKSVKATVKSGPAKVEFVIQEEKPTFKVTGEDIPGELYLQFLENMNSMVNDIFYMDGEGLYDYNDKTGTAEVKQEFVSEPEQQPIYESMQIETAAPAIEVKRDDVIEATFTEVVELVDASEFEMSEEEIISEMKEVIGEDNINIQQGLEDIPATTELPVEEVVVAVDKIHAETELSPVEGSSEEPVTSDAPVWAINSAWQ